MYMPSVGFQPSGIKDGLVYIPVAAISLDNGVAGGPKTDNVHPLVGYSQPRSYQRLPKDTCDVHTPTSLCSF